MIAKESLAALAELYDFAHQNLNPNDPGINDARDLLEAELRAQYDLAFPGRSVTYGEFKREAIRQMKRHLKT